MFSTLIQGFFLSAAMILPLGPQNVFVMQQGSRKQFHLMSATLCSISDALFIMAGIFGGSALLGQSTLLLHAVTWGGAVFLLWYGWGALRTALSADVELSRTEKTVQSRWRVVVTLFAVTWLNPHVYLDTFVVLGSIGGQLSAELRPWFTTGAVMASISWFFALSLLSAWFAPVLNQPRAQRIINIFVACVMWYIAWSLIRKGIQIFY
ncbi:arginine exporter ArgO [Xenorhabdus sp. DI]|uniref:arginine exporter ArgO n=1 Tax=Xenorhabdus doucetiae TaxID=351671 RepID=UPI0019A92695|nr:MULTISPECIES: arginine exporter ArgO [unclassified Xenorhabdus]MBD2785244.1 arginine exporter ArgO [Xenorhabdus sp. 3]MBD2787663.1 arginine exporter ArgO [Xenorhabdus sp. DI]